MGYIDQLKINKLFFFQFFAFLSPILLQKEEQINKSKNKHKNSDT